MIVIIIIGLIVGCQECKCCFMDQSELDDHKERCSKKAEKMAPEIQHLYPYPYEPFNSSS